jgi:hypothetical protein
MAPVTADSGRASANDYIEKLLMFADGVSTPVPPATRAAYAQKRVAMENAGTLASYLRHAKAGDLFLAILKYGSVPTFPIIEDGKRHAPGRLDPGHPIGQLQQDADHPG